jgi:carnitine O-acetyltransferase
MAKNEKTSKRIASLGGRALRDPGSLTLAEIRELGGSVLTQAPDKPKPKKRKPSP